MNSNLRKKIKIVSRVTLIVIHIQCLLCAMLLANGSNAQYMRDIYLTVLWEDASIDEVFTSLNEKTGFNFLFNDKKVSKINGISFNAQNESLEGILKKLSLKKELQFKRVNNTISVTKYNYEIASDDSRVLELVDVDVSGKITDENNQGLPGASVVVKGTTTGTTTDLEGNYELAVPEHGTLTISYVGYLTQDVVIGIQNIVDVQMVVDTEQLEEIVVVGYGSIKKSDLTGSVSSLKSKDFNAGANVSVDQLISGRAAGVLVTQTSSEPGGGVSIRIRGASSINAQNEPLYVIDGVAMDNSSLLSASSADATSSENGAAFLSINVNPKNPLNSLNPNDIESIEILKDASSTAIYGSRGANGVVLITTKKGSAGEARVSYDFYTGIQTVAKKLDVLTTTEYIDVINGISEDNNNGAVFSSADISAIGAGTDWQDEIFEDAIVQSHNATVSGGTKKTTYYTSLNYFDQAGVLKNTGIKKYIGRLKVLHDLSEKISVGFSVNTSLIKDNNSIDGLNINEEAGPVNTAFLYDPTEPVKNTDGTFFRSPNLTINNPVSLVEGVSSISETNRTFSNVTFNYEIIKDLKAKVNFSSDRQNNTRDIYNSRLTIHGESNGGAANISTLQLSNVLTEFTLAYFKDINENQTISALGGITYQQFSLKAAATSISGFPTDFLKTNNLSLGNPAFSSTFSNKEENQLLSYLARVNYSLMSKYLLTVSLRADGSSKFGKNNKYGYFPSFALGWKLEEESFTPDFFNQLKLRTSWGLTGNQGIPNYASLSTFQGGPTAILGGAQTTGTVPSRIANPDLKWETTEQFNIGVDFEIFEGRISGAIDYFKKNTRDMLLNLPLPLSSGFGSVLSNVGEMENSGFEILISSINVDAEDFSWKSTLNFSAIKNKVNDIGGLSSINLGNVQNVGNTTIIQPGFPVSSYFGYDITGIYQTADEVAQSAQPGSQPGYPIFRDVNKDDQITPADQIILGNPFPDFTYGLQNSFRFKNLQVDIFLQGQEGASLLNINAIESIYPSNSRRNKFSEQGLDRWTTSNTNAKWPSGTNPNAYGPGKVSNLVVEDASYLRLKTVQISYTWPTTKLSFLQSARVYITGQNLFTLTDYSGYDPEVNSFGQSNARIDYSSYPLARTWMLGVNLGF